MAFKKVISTQIRIETGEDFAQLLKSANGKEQDYFDKVFELTNVADNPYYVTGLVITTKKTGIPPKRDYVLKKTSKLPLSAREGLAFGNIFLYDKKHKILMFEFNKNGIYLNNFLHFIGYYGATPEVSILADPILNKNSYSKMKKFNRLTSFEVSVASPRVEISDAELKNDSLINIVQLGKTINCRHSTHKFTLGHSKSDSLHKTEILQLIKSIFKFDNEIEDFAKKVELTGYTTDPDHPDKSKRSIIDLVIDTYKSGFDLPEDDLENDLKLIERKNKIVDLYNKCLPDFEEILKNG